MTGLPDDVSENCDIRSRKLAAPMLLSLASGAKL